MKLHTLLLTNFRQHSDTLISFEDGITGVLGANGSGKSTVLEGIAYALYGSEAIRGTKRTIRWDRAPARRVAEVSLTFEHGGQMYSVDRSENTATLSMGATELGAIIADGTSAVDAFIPQLLGMAYREFAASYLCAQKDLMRLASMGPTERQTFYREVMGVGRVDEALATARERRSTLARQREAMAAGLGERGPLEAELQEARSLAAMADAGAETSRTARAAAVSEAERAAAAEAEHSRRHAEHVRLAGTLTMATAERDARARELVDLDERIAGARAALERAESLRPQLATLPEKRRERDELGVARGTAEERTSLSSRIASADLEIARLEVQESNLSTIAFNDGDKLEAARAELERLEQAASADRQAWLVSRATAATKRQDAEALLRREERKIEAIEGAGASGACPTCLRALGEAFAPVVADLHESAESLRQSIAGIASIEALPDPSIAAHAGITAVRTQVEGLELDARRAEAAGRDRENVRQQLAAIRTARSQNTDRLAALPTVDWDSARLAEIESQISGLELLGQRVAADSARGDELAGLETMRAVRVDVIGKAVRAMDDLQESLTALGYDTEAHQLAVAAHRAAVRAKEEAVSDAAVAEGRIQAAKERVDRALQTLSSYDSRALLLTETAEQLRIANVCAERLGEFRVSVASGIRPEMEELVTGFVALLTDGRYEAATIGEDFSCTLYRSGVPVEVISGGEEDVVAVAMRLATSQMIAERAGHPLSLLILDEVFGSLDDVRRSNALALFRRLRGVFPQILLISHIPESQHQVDHVVSIEFDESRGCSVVRAPVALELAGLETAEVANV